MGDVTFDKLYDNYNVLSEAKDKIVQYSDEYAEAIKGTKGDEKEKKLAAQIISKFFKHFPALQAKAIEAIFDLCEDDDTTIRIAAMKALPTFCKDNKEFVSKVADILAQLLQLDDAQEYNVACNCLLSVLKEDAATCIKAIFKQINVSAEQVVREKCIKFLVTKVKALDKSILTSEIEDIIIAEAKKILQDGTSDDYIGLIPFLIDTKLGKTVAGQQELVDIAAEQAELDQEFDPLDKENNNIARLITCIKSVLPLFSSKVDSQKFVIYICDQVLPRWDLIGKLEQAELIQLAVLQQLAELSTHCGKLENPSLHVVQIFDKLKMYMPPPPEDVNVQTLPFLEFSIVESLLYAFHRLARQCPDFLTHDPQVLRDFRSRLTYFSRAVQSCTKSLNQIKKKEDNSLTEEELKKKQVSPKMLDNIKEIIKDLFYQPPMYKCNVTLSFITDDKFAKRKISEKELPVTPNKRHIPITFDGNNSGPGKRPRSGDNLKMYTPPSGKFSNSFTSYDNDRRSSRGRGGRGSRGRNRGPGRWRN